MKFVTRSNSLNTSITTLRNSWKSERKASGFLTNLRSKDEPCASVWIYFSNEHVFWDKIDMEEDQTQNLSRMSSHLSGYWFSLFFCLLVLFFYIWNCWFILSLKKCTWWYNHFEMDKPISDSFTHWGRIFDNLSSEKCIPIYIIHPMYNFRLFKSGITLFIMSAEIITHLKSIFNDWLTYAITELITEIDFANFRQYIEWIVAT